jgi:hypothetical protein
VEFLGIIKRGELIAPQMKTSFKDIVQPKKRGV